MASVANRPSECKCSKNLFSCNNCHERPRESDRNTPEYILHDIGLQVIMLLKLVVTTICGRGSRVEQALKIMKDIDNDFFIQAREKATLGRD